VHILKFNCFTSISLLKCSSKLTSRLTWSVADGACQVSDRPKWSGANMAQALGHLQLEETSSAMEGLICISFSVPD